MLDARKVLAAGIVVGALIGAAGCASSGQHAPRASSVATSDGAAASADPIGASLFARSRDNDQSPAPVLATAPVRE